MAHGLSVLICAHGERSWSDLAWSRAYPSVREQVEERDIHVVYSPSATLAECRNLGGSWAATEWICFLDADDELEPNFVHSMLAALRSCSYQDALYAPMVRFVYPNDPKPRRPLHPNRHVPMEVANWCVIGTVMKREAFLESGGFREYEAYEDWDLFLRLHLAGRPVIDVNGAIYRAHVDAAGRNSQRPAILGRAYRAIKQANGLPEVVPRTQRARRGR